MEDLNETVRQVLQQEAKAAKETFDYAREQLADRAEALATAETRFADAEKRWEDLQQFYPGECDRRQGDGGVW